MKIGCLLSAREKATRLPNKVLLDVGGKPLILALLERLSLAKLPAELILSTSTHPDDDILVEIAIKNGYSFYRGSENDKLDRYYKTAITYGLDGVIIVDGDDPFCFPEGIDKVATALVKEKVDCVYLSGLPIGAASTGLTTDALSRVLKIKDENDTEVWGKYFIGSGRFNCVELKFEEPLFNRPDIRLTVDYPEDYNLVTQIVTSFSGALDFSSADLMKLLVYERPELCSINREAQSRYEAHLEKSAPVKFKCNEFKVLVIGLGSMGKRRVRNLIANGVSNEKIIGFDLRADRITEAAEKYSIQTINQILSRDYKDISAVVISTPPDQHLFYAEIAAKHGIPMFIEASVISDGLIELADRTELAGITVFPSCTMRYFGGPKRIGELLRENSIGKILAWQYQSGQYLPDWHPWESISDFYVSNKMTGGCREIVPFELVWLEPIFGKVRDIECRHTKQSSLPADIDDIYMLQIEHESGVLGQLVVDVLGRAPIRYMRITGSEGTIEWDDSNKQLRLYKVAIGSWVTERVGDGDTESLYINPEQPYIEEIKTFLDCLRHNIKPAYSLRDDIRMLSILQAAERAHLTKERQIIY